MATANRMRALNRLPYDFEDGLKIAGVDVTTLNQIGTANGAGLVGFAPVGGLSSNNVQSAIAELDTEKVGKSELADTEGAALVGYDSINARTVFDNARPIADYTALRAYAGRAAQVRITSTGIAGFFYYDASDTSSTDNGGTIIVSANGRRWKRLFDGAVNVKWFGAKGDGSDDGASVQKAVDYLKPFGSGKILFEYGKNYKWATVKIFAGIHIDLNGSTVTMLDNQPDFSRIFTMAATGYYYNGASSSQPTIIENGILDVNRQNQGTYTGYEKEHHAAICLAADVTSQGKVLAHIRNLIIKESCGDGINLTYGIKGTIENCHFSNHFRGGIVASGGGHDITVRDCTSGGDVHDKALDFEPIPSLGAAYRLTIDNFKVGGKVDIGAGNCPGSRIVVSNLTMSSPAFTLFGSEGTKFIFNDCRLVTTDNSNISVIRQWRDATFNRCTILAEKTVGGAEPVYGLFAWHDDIPNQILKLNKCRFEVGTSVTAGDTVYGIYQNAMSIATRCKLQMDDCEFTGYDYAVWTRGSELEVRNSKADSDFFYIRGLVGTYENIITVQGRLTLSTGKVPFRQDGSTAQAVIKFFEHEVDAGTGAAGSGENSLLFSGWTNITKIGSRRLKVTAAPSGGGLVGDVAVLSNPTFGAASEWISTNNHNTAATWKMIRQAGIAKDITSNRPAAGALDSGLTYLDTTLDPDGKPIWWTGTAWVDSTGTVV